MDLSVRDEFAGRVQMELEKASPGGEEMKGHERGGRLPVTPATKREYDIVVRLGRKLRPAAR